MTCSNIFSSDDDFAPGRIVRDSVLREKLYVRKNVEKRHNVLKIIIIKYFNFIREHCYKFKENDIVNKTTFRILFNNL